MTRADSVKGFTVRAMLRAVRLNCKDCMGGPKNKGWIKLVRGCSSKDTCSLWKYRLGKIPRK